MRATPTTLLAESTGLSECMDRLAARKQHDRPISTYRLQFHGGFRFEDALPLVAYLHTLGISHAYSSPILQARAGSMHGYDITDHNCINPEIGSEAEFHQFASELRTRGMGLILDFVPNHMGVGQGTNPWWQDVLENGQASRYADFFDIDWRPLKHELHGRVLLPILGGQYGEELEHGRISLKYEGGRFFVQYYGNQLPIDPHTYPLVFEPVGDFRMLPSEMALSDAERAEFENILWEMRELPPHLTTDPELVVRRQNTAPALVRRLHQLEQRSPNVRRLIEEALHRLNGEPGNSHSFDALHRLLEAQAYRLAHWRVSAEEINYRRFFDINELVGIRMENPHVFAATHRLIRKLLAEGALQGLRLDHPDGLFNPRQYFARVQMLYAASQCCGPEPRPPLAENGIEQAVQTIFGQHDWLNNRAPLYVLVEKILEPGESLRSDWPVDGTVGYDFANLVNGLFIDAKNQRAFTNLYHRFIGGAIDVESVIYESKKLILQSALASELTVLTHMLEDISSTDRRARDFTRKALTDAIREVIACFPVYRTYIDERGNVGQEDRAYINEAIARAKRRNESTSAAIFDHLREVLLLASGNGSTEGYRKRLYFTLKFQQLTGPVMAKGLEDTACYVYNRLVSVNEVGGSPREFGISVESFHSASSERTEKWPYSMLATSSHDTKRSEDVRARINVLSEMPKQWSANVLRWRRTNRSRKRLLGDGRYVPDANEEYLLYQTLVGTWPFEIAGEKQHQEFTERIQRYMNKAVHEAKVNLSWVNDNPEYLEALGKFVDAILQPATGSRPNAFLQQLEKFASMVGFFGAMNSLSQVVLRVASPGVPDLYQGTELWDFSLVDPDNRRPVDFELRQRLLDDLLARQESGMVELCRELLRHYIDGRIKLWTTMRALRCRRDHQSVFQGAYIPLSAAGHKAQHLVAFARVSNDEMAIVAVPRLAYSLLAGRMEPPIGEVWGNTEIQLPPRSAGDLWNVFTGEVWPVGNARSIACRDVFANFPVALLLAG